MPTSVQLDPDTGEIIRRQTSVWLPVETFDDAAILARAWRLPPSRFFSNVVVRALREAVAALPPSQRAPYGQAAPSEDADA
jgi:hypothetical protein